jgi:hypothetical protein
LAKGPAFGARVSISAVAMVPTVVAEATVEVSLVAATPSSWSRSPDQRRSPEHQRQQRLFPTRRVGPAVLADLLARHAAQLEQGIRVIAPQPRRNVRCHALDAAAHDDNPPDDPRMLGPIDQRWGLLRHGGAA